MVIKQIILLSCNKSKCEVITHVLGLQTEAFKFDIKNEIHIIREALVGILNGITNA